MRLRRSETEWGEQSNQVRGFSCHACSIDSVIGKQTIFLWYLIVIAFAVPHCTRKLRRQLSTRAVSFKWPTFVRIPRDTTHRYFLRMKFNTINITNVCFSSSVCDIPSCVYNENEWHRFQRFSSIKKINGIAHLKRTSQNISNGACSCNNHFGSLLESDSKLPNSFHAIERRRCLNALNINISSETKAN